ncbi:ATP-binding protein [bacterium]|nr:ATP-binding protein [bacterium]
MIKRFLFNKLIAEIGQREINIILGPRQVGKTTLLKGLKGYAEGEGFSTVFFDLEQPQVLAEFNISDSEIIEKIEGSSQIVFIDEFQYIKNVSRILKAVYDSDIRIKIFCSGSSSLEIHKHLKESLAGRKFLFRLYPLQFSEIRENTPEYPLDLYLRYGGMPGLTHADSEDRKQQILAELLSSYILKDIKSLIKEENIRSFNHLLYLLAERQGSTISIHSLASQIGLSAKAVNRYLDILEETYVNYRIYSYSQNLGNELKKSCKTYLYDLGIRNALLKDFSGITDRPDRGILLESYVFLKLQTMLAPNMEIKFWRTKDGDEVDFILLVNRRPIPIEVKSGLSRLEIPKGIKRFLLRYRDIKRAFVINERITDSLEYNGCTIDFINFDMFERKGIKNFLCQDPVS